MPREIRFTVTDGEKRSASWTCIGGKDNSVYLLCRELKTMSKFSFHGTGDWRNAFTEKFMEEERLAGTSPLPERVFDQWPRPVPIAPGVTLACRIVVPKAAVTEPLEPLPAKLRTIAAPEFPNALEVALIFTAQGTPVSGWPGKRSMNTELIDSFVLPNGEHVWLVYHTIEGIQPGSLKLNPLFFSGAQQQLRPPHQLRMLIYGDEQDGSRTVTELAISEEQTELILSKASPTPARLERTPS